MRRKKKPPYHEINLHNVLKTLVKLGRAEARGEGSKGGAGQHVALLGIEVLSKQKKKAR